MVFVVVPAGEEVVDLDAHVLEGFEIKSLGGIADFDELGSLVSWFGDAD